MKPGITLKRTDSSDPDFQKLVAKLDDELRIRDGENHAFYAELNKTAFLKHAIVLYENNSPIGSGAFRPYTETVMELKRMYVVPSERGKGIASIILAALEMWCRELTIEQCILETGKNQPEAIALYQKNGYIPIPAYGKYVGAENSVCFKKTLNII